MRTVANLITNLFELTGGLFVLAVVTSVLVSSIDVVGPTIYWIETNMILALGIALTYILYKSESDL
jgi:hypothetical protein